MRLRNDEHGYGLVTKALHWLTVAAVVAQVTVGYLIEDSGRGRGRGRGEGSGRGRGRGGDIDLDESTVRMHIVLGCVIIALAATRIIWRRTTPLPPWSERLSARDRVVQHWVERVLLLMLLATPASGIALVLSGDDDLLPLHVTCHILLYLAIAAHVTLVVRRRTVARMFTVGP